MNPEPAKRKPGRPKAIPENMVSEVLSLYREGLGYRGIARELRGQGLSVDWSTVRRLVKAGTPLDREQDNQPCDSNTIMTLVIPDGAGSAIRADYDTVSKVIEED